MSSLQNEVDNISAKFCGWDYRKEEMLFSQLPLLALHAYGPYKLHDLLLGISVHRFTVGLPISFSVRRFAK